MMSPKKLGLGIFVLIIAAVIYYFNHTEQVKDLTKLQEKVTVQLTLMQTNGFSISDREIKKEKEHFFITLVDPTKAIVFFAQKGIRVKLEEAEELKGLKLSVDLTYLHDTIALDLYPVALPTDLKTLLTTENNKDLLVQIDTMIKKKTFFTHIDMDHSATTFKGYVKDINETIIGEKEAKLTLQGYHFSGEMKEEKITKYSQTLNASHLYISDIIDRYISGLKSDYVLTGTTAYDYTADYTIEKLRIDEAPESTLLANDIILLSTSSVKNGLAVETFKTKIKNIDLIFEEEKFGMQTLDMDMNVSNISVEVLDKLQTLDSKNEKEFDTLLETLVSKNIHLDIPMLSVDRVILHGEEMLGFSLNANLDIDQSLNIYRLDINPKHAIDKIDGVIDLSLSKEILTLLKEDPKFMLMYMMYRPKRSLGQRIYHINISDGAVRINGKLLEY